MAENPFTGQDVVMKFAYGKDGTPATLIGRVTTKTLNSSLDNIDVTSDDSPSGYREFIPSFKSGSISIATYPSRDTTRSAAVDALEAFFHDPSTQTLADQYLTIELLRPKSEVASAAYNRTYTFNILMTAFNAEFPADGAANFSLEGTIDGAIVIADAAAA